MKKFISVLIITLTVLAVCTVIFFAVFLIKWNQCTQTKSVPEVVQTIFPDKKIKLGDKTPCTFQVKTSWSLMPASAVITPTEGLQEGKRAEITPGKWMWGTRIWNVTVWIQPYRDGNYTETPVRILCEGGPDGKAVADAKIPGFKAELEQVDNSQQLEIAEEVSEKQEQKNHRRIWDPIGGGIILLALLISLYFFLRKRRKEQQIPAWVTAENDIAELRRSLHEGKITPENAIIQLTYIIRCYLEKRFSLRAEYQTTAEFLESLRRDSSPLDWEQKRFLEEFLSAADMVKFAKLSTDEATFGEAAQRADSLIRTTSLEPERKEK